MQRPDLVVFDRDRTAVELRHRYVDVLYLGERLVLEKLEREGFA
jgi:hypothetical protein